MLVCHLRISKKRRFWHWSRPILWCVHVACCVCVVCACVVHGVVCACYDVCMLWCVHAMMCACGCVLWCVHVLPLLVWLILFFSHADLADTTTVHSGWYCQVSKEFSMCLIGWKLTYLSGTSYNYGILMHGEKGCSTVHKRCSRWILTAEPCATYPGFVCDTTIYNGVTGC